MNFLHKWCCSCQNKKSISDVEDLLNQKERAFKDRNRVEQRHVQRELSSDWGRWRRPTGGRWSRSCRGTTWGRCGMEWKPSHAVSRETAAQHSVVWRESLLQQVWLSYSCFYTFSLSSSHLQTGGVPSKHLQSEPATGKVPHTVEDILPCSKINLKIVGPRFYTSGESFIQ